jgi:hypothetical protein
MGTIRKYFSARGMSLVSVLLGVAVAAAVAAGLSQILQRSLERLRYVMTAADLRDIRLHLSAAVDCTESLKPPATCTGKTSIQLLDTKGLTLVKPYPDAAPTKVGRYPIRAACDGSQLKMQVQVNGVWQDLYKPSAPFPCQF